MQKISIITDYQETVKNDNKISSSHNSKKGLQKYLEQSAEKMMEKRKPYPLLMEI